MLFNSLGFVLFFTVILGLYYGPFLNWTSKKIMLLLSSYLFYALWNPPLILLLWISTLIDWWTGNRLMHTNTPSKRKALLLLSMVVNLGFLAFFKYGNFILENFTLMVNQLGWEYQPRPMDILLPMGISFYTFQTMSYTIDIYQRKITPARNFLDFALYVTFFPQLVAGPIVRAKDLISQFYSERRATLNQFLWGIFLLTLGLFEKIVLADTLLSGTSDTIFDSDQILNFWDAWAGTLAFSGQIFFDFAGYSTCAIGIGQMLGFHLPDNFLYPYGAIGFSDLWRRWHITLSTWLRDYLYIPLGGNRFGISRMYLALMLTMLLGGLWHGAAWTFVAWGALHGIYLVLEKVFKSRFTISTSHRASIILAWMTFMAVNLTWVFFRAQDFSKARDMLASMFLLHPEGEKLLGYFDLTKVGVVIGLLFLCHWWMRNADLQDKVMRLSPVSLGLGWGIMLFLIIIAQGSSSQFIYFQF